MSGESRIVIKDDSDKALTFKAQDVVMLTARLAQLLAEEVDLLGDMKVKKIEALQKEKVFLTNALEAQRKLIERHPYMKDTIPSRDKKDLEDVAAVFQNILEENHRKLLLAKEINHKIVQAITDVVKETTQSRTYNGNGYTGMAAFNTLSITLNKTI
ncbi:MAG: hypothetical protein ABL857_01575 [Rickettsiales bacterium]|jgi:hypothetical protein